MVRMAIGEVQAQTAAISHYCDTLEARANTFQSTTQAIALDIGITGKTGNSIRSYLSSVYPSIAKSLIMHSEKIKSANKAYLEGYISACGAKDLDSEELQRQINAYKTTISGYERQKRNAESFYNGLEPASKMAFSANYYDSINGFRAAINTTKELLRKVEELKEKLETFDSQSTSYFSDISESAALVNEGLTSIGMDAEGNIGTSSWNGQVFSSTEKKWLETVNKKWEERRYAKEHKELLRLEEKWANLTYEIRHVPGQNGMVAKEIWVDGKFDRNLTQEHQVLEGMRQRRKILENPPSLAPFDFLTDFIPLVGELKVIFSRNATKKDKIMAGFFLIPTLKPIDFAMDSLKYLDRVADTGRALDNANDMGRALDKADDMGRGLDKTNDLNKSLDGANDVKKASELENISPSEIRFSQTSVNGSGEIISSMKANGWKGDPIDVVRMPDSSLTTLDNTRVAAAREVGIDVQANVRNFDELLPDNLVDRFTTKKGIPKTWGDATELRIKKQKANFRNNNPMGSFDLDKMK